MVLPMARCVVVDGCESSRDQGKMTSGASCSFNIAHKCGSLLKSSS